jgi:hypothetical protein
VSDFIHAKLMDHFTWPYLEKHPLKAAGVLETV